MLRLLFLTVLFVSTIVPTAAQQVFIVNTDKDTVNWNDGVLSLREAVDTTNALTGKQIIVFDKLFFHPDSHRVIRMKDELVLKDKDGTVIKGDSAFFVIDGGEPALDDTTKPDTIAYEAFRLTSGKNEISNLAIMNYGCSGVFIDSGNAGGNIIGPGNKFINCGEGGICIQASHHNVIGGNYVKWCGLPYYARRLGGGGIMSQKAYFWYCDGIWLFDNAYTNTIMYNIIQESFAAGLGTYSSSNTTVKYNSFVSNSDYGVYIEEGWGNNTIESNVIVGSGYDAIALYGFWNIKNLIRWNKIGDSTHFATLRANLLQKFGLNNEDVNKSIANNAKNEAVKYKASKKHREKSQPERIKPERADKRQRTKQTSLAMRVQTPTSIGDDGVALYGAGETVIMENEIYACGYAAVYIEAQYDSINLCPKGILVEHNKLLSNDESGVEFYDVKEITIRDNAIINNYYGIYGANYPDTSIFFSTVFVKGNQIENGWGEGIYLDEVNFTEVLNNRIYRFSYGIEFYKVQKGIVGFNDLRTLDDEGFYGSYVDSLWIHHNNFIDAWGDGIYLYHRTDSSGFAEMWENTMMGNDYYAIDTYKFGTMNIHHNRIDANYAGVYIEYSRNITFEENIVKDCASNLFYGEYTKQMILSKNQFINSYEEFAVELYKVKSVLFKENFLKDGAGGLSTYYVDSLWITRNQFISSKDEGIDVYYSVYVNIYDNDIYGHLYYGIYAGYNKKVIVEKNNISMNIDFGLRSNRNSEIVVFENTIIDNSYDAVYCSSDTLVKFYNNYFASNGIGLSLYYIVNNASKVTGNSFIKHSYEALYYYGGFPLDARNNYWGHQTGPYNPNDTDTLHQVNNGGGGEVSENVYFVPFANAPLYNSASKPVITSVEPPFSPRAGGGTAMIYGRQMLKGVKVFFGKDTIKTVQYGASDVIAIVVPPGRGGPVDVIVQNPNGKVDTLKRGFFYENHPPLGVALSSPSMGSTVTTGRPTFKWQKVIDPDGDEVVYSFVISRSEFFEDSISAVGIADTFYLLKDTTLSPNTSYFWRIVASDTREGYSTSPIGQFTTSNILSIDDEKKIPLTYELHQNYPNPFNPITTIRFDLPHSRNVMIEVFDILGRRVTVLANGIIDAGYHSIVWNGRNQNSETISSGVYFYRITAGNYVKTRRMLMLK